MNDWMRRLACHYERMRRSYHRDKLIILFDIDGTILDSRCMIYSALKSYDRARKTEQFSALSIEAITVHESNVETLLADLDVPAGARGDIIEWYRVFCWSKEAILTAHRPFAGVIETIRWFQLQPDTYVGLNTGRPDFLRGDTLQCLNRIGRAYKVTFDDVLLYMNPGGWTYDITCSKCRGLSHFQTLGYRVFAFVDNEPENLAAIKEVDGTGDILLLHADTVFRSQRHRVPEESVSGKTYDITKLIDERRLPRHVQFVWHGVTDGDTMERFLSSNIQWAQFDVRRDLWTDDILCCDAAVKFDRFSDTRNVMRARGMIRNLMTLGKSLKLDVKEHGSLVDGIIELLKELDVPDERLWLNGRIEVLGERGFRRLAEAFPGAIIQCPIDYMAPLIFGVAGKALSILDHFTEWGINRFSVGWNVPNLPALLEKMNQWGFETNIYNVADLEAFLKAVLLSPDSVTSDFDFPQWNRFAEEKNDSSKKIHSPGKSVEYGYAS